jgi:DnaJ-class molecular chaperone
MSTFDSDKTGAFIRKPCADCHGTGELRIESENINENFEVEKQTVITVCSRCNGTGSVVPDAEKTAPAGLFPSLR